MNTFTISYAASLLAATPAAYLVPGRRRRLKGLTDEQMNLMQRESASLDREFRLVEATYASDHLDLVLGKGYVAKLLANRKVERFMTGHYPELLAELAHGVRGSD